MPSSADDLVRFPSWLKDINLALGVAAYMIAFVIVWNFDSLAQRLVAATASFAVPISMALLLGVLRNHSLITGKGDEAQNQRLITESVDLNASAQQASDNVMKSDIAFISPISHTLSHRYHQLAFVVKRYVVGVGVVVAFRDCKRSIAWRS